MINFIINKKDKDNKKILYALFYLTENYNDKIIISSTWAQDCVNVYYGVEPEKKGCIYIPRDYNDYSDKGIYYNHYKDKEYMTFGKKVENPFCLQNDNILFTFDIMKISFFLISCSEEYDIKKRDTMDRFIASYSRRVDKITIPFFDVNSYILYEALRNFNKDLDLKKKKFEILLTHDVDNVNSRNKYVLLHNSKELLLNKKSSFIDRVKNLVCDVVHNRHLQIENYIKIETEKNAKSEFYFIEGIKHRLGKRYTLDSLKKQIDLLKQDSRFIVGVHVNFFSYENEEAIKNEMNCIENVIQSKIISSRNHYLRFNVPNTWEVLKESGIICDSTLGYSDKNGFRAAISKPFLPYNKFTDDIVPIFEVPLVVMDGIIMETQMTFEEKWLSIKNIIDHVIEYHGTASILWHQRVIYDEQYKEMYEKILDYINYKDGKFILSTDLISKYEEQKKELEILFNDSSEEK